METGLSIGVGIALAAACGFRVFVPLLVISTAALSGHVELAESFAWVGTWPALVTFAVATILEIAAYYIPWLDNALDTVATPAAVVAGIVVTASVLTDMSPYLRWTLAVIAGGGAAGLVQGTTVSVRGTSTLSTAGAANPVVSTVEAAGSLLTSVLAVVWPVLALAVVVLVLGLFMRRKVRASACRSHR
jgi:hypothetical protein